jgi:hypothetical protein
MIHQVEKYKDESSELRKKIQKIDKLIEVYKEVEGTDIPELSKFQTQRKQHLDRIKKIDKLIDSMQDVCEHTLPNGKTAFEYEGHDSHKDYYICVLCGKGDSV